MTGRGWVLSVAIVFSIICLAVLWRLPEPKAIEAAQNAAKLEEMKATWGVVGGARLGFALGFDYLFMAAYVTAIGLGCITVSRRAPGFLARLGRILGYAQIATGLIDATENATLIRLLVAGFSERIMGIARLATASKFVIPVAGLVYILAAGLLSRGRAGMARIPEKIRYE